MRGRKLFWQRLQHGSTKCCKCGHRFGKNETKYSPFPVDMRLGSVCAECKAKDEEIASLRALIKDMVDAVSENMTAQCLHCDLRDACQEGEDGIVVSCNHVIKLREALEQAREVLNG